MNKHKKDSSKQEEEKKSKANPNLGDQGEEETDNGQAMVALTFDEYDALEKQIESLQEEVESQKEGWLRTRADFDNYKKRVQRDAARSHQDSLTSILKIFLGVIDDIERALNNAPEGTELASWIDGIELIHQKLLNQLKNQGVERLDVNPGDDFDPNIHEAITQEEHAQFTEGQIIEVVQQGYQISDRIIRPAMVRVAQ